MFNEVEIGYQGCIHGNHSTYTMHRVSNARDSHCAESGLQGGIHCRIILYPPHHLAGERFMCTSVTKKLLSHREVICEGSVKRCKKHVSLLWISIHKVQVKTNQIMFVISIENSYKSTFCLETASSCTF